MKSKKMKEQKSSGWGLIVDKSNATEYFSTRVYESLAKDKAAKNQSDSDEKSRVRQVRAR
jgi:hypothetical protein